MKRRLALLTLVVALGVPAAAVAATGYASVGDVSGTSSSSPGGSLPFTGLDLEIVAGSGLGLLGLGLVLRRAERRHGD
jgi:hypothetical protein